MSLLPNWMRRRSDLYTIPADVIVYKDGDYAVAIDGKTKKEIMRSDNHADVINTAIDEVPEYGVVQMLGEFIINKTINITKPLTIIGGKFIRSGEGFALFEINNVSDIIIRNIVLDNLGDQSVYNYDSKGIWVVGQSSYIKISDVEVVNSQGNPIILEQDSSGNVPSNIYIVNNVIKNSLGDGMFIRGNNVTILGNYIITVNDTAIDITAPSGGTIEKITVMMNNVYGSLTGIGVSRGVNDVVIEGNITRNGDGERGAIYVTYYESGQPAPDRVVISNNTIKNSVAGIRCIGDGNDRTLVIIGNVVETITYQYGSGIIIDNYPNSILVGNKINDVQYLHGIYIYSSSNCVVEANSIYSINDTGIFIRNSKYVQVRNNIIVGANYAIREYVGTNETTDYNIIEGNNMSNITSGVNIIGTHTYYDGKIYDSLPTDGFAITNKPILYYDGTYYYLAVWNGSAWVKVQLS